MAPQAGHPHSHPDSPGSYDTREPFELHASTRAYNERAFTIGIGGPVGSGKTALTLSLCRHLRDSYGIVVVTNDIFTKEDGEFLTKHEALTPTDRIRAVETGGCPHGAIREDCSANLQMVENLTREYKPDFCLLEAGGDNLSANFSRELADYIIYVIDVAGGDKIPRKGGPGITQADLLVVNKTDLAEAVGADLELMRVQGTAMRGAGPIVFAQVKHMVGVDAVAQHFLDVWRRTSAGQRWAQAQQAQPAAAGQPAGEKRRRAEGEPSADDDEAPPLEPIPKKSNA